MTSFRRTQTGRRVMSMRFKPHFLALVSSSLLVIFIMSLISGCSPFYIMRAAYEEGKILWRREPITEFLAKPDVVPDAQEKLRLVLAVREYARDVLKMNVRGSYSSYSYVDRPDLAYIVTAAPRTELVPYTWWFLFVGRVPYKGFFSKEDADKAAADLQAKGYDTYIRTTAAFSTLGWFDDPLLSHLLRYDKVTLASIIFHELLHSTLYVRGASDFNESLANFVGGRATIDFFRDRFGEGSAEHREAIREWQEEIEFSNFIGDCAKSLTALYQKDIPYEEKLRLREEVFQQAKEEWLRRIANEPSNRFRGFAKQPLTNAILIHYLLYFKQLQLFESLYNANDQNLLKSIESVRQAVEEGGEPFERLQALVATHKNLS